MAPKNIKTVGPVQVYPFVLQPGCTDGQKISDEQIKKSTVKHEAIKVPLDDSHYTSWKISLGGLLRDQLFPGDPRTFYLQDFPEHYHLRSKDKKAKEDGTDPGKDYYLYGMEGDTTKTFRSPNEFFPHLLWLASGDNNKSQNCSCKHCGIPITTATTGSAATPVARSATPVDVQSTSMKRSLSNSSAASKASTAIKQAGPATAPKRKVNPTPTPTTVGQTQNQGPTQPQIQAQEPIKQTQAQGQIPPQTQAQGHIQTQAQEPNAAQAQAQKHSVQQASRMHLDESALFRDGEVVWFKNNNAWRLGIILKTGPLDSSGSLQNKCLVQPIAHAYLKLETVLKTDNDIRPFLAFSVPALNMKELQGKFFQQIPWQQLQASCGPDRQRQELLGLDASKMAVTEMDHSYSTFNRIAEAAPRPGMQYFGGVFLGAEKICVSEAVRVQVTETDIDLNLVRGLPIVMVVRAIIFLETNNQLFFSGELYRLEETANPQQAPNQTQLPPSMLREKAFRDMVKKAAGTRFDWILVKPNLTKPEKMVRGRFYETSRLMAILDPPRFTQALEKGVVEDVQAYLNNRLASTGTFTGGRKKSRLHMLAGALPAEFRFTWGPSVVESS